MGYIKRIVRAGGDCLVVVHKEVVSTLAAQTRVPGFNSIHIGVSLSSPLSRNSKINNSS